jgi:hypothetical protein
VFDIGEKSSTFLREIITLMSSANKMGSNEEFIVGGRSFICIMKSKGPKIDPWGIHLLLFLILRKISVTILLHFFFLSDGM